MSSPRPSFSLEGHHRQWLREACPENEEGPCDNALESWVLRQMSRGEILDVQGVMVDRALLEARFACIPERCSPAVARGQYRSCCADLVVSLSPKERGRLLRRRRLLGEHLGAREEILRGSGPVSPSYWLDDEDVALARPHGRCAFSKIEKDGRIRCHLHTFAKAQGLALADVQPHSCGLFPLALFELSPGRFLLTMLQKSNHKLLGALPPNRFPCLSDDKQPPLIDSMRHTLDRLFGQGFAKALRGARPGAP